MSAVIDVASGLMLLYLLLSLLCTTINELFSTVLALRARTLAGGVQRLIDDPQLRTSFDQHGLIRSLQAASGRMPSYLSSKTFAMALLGSLNPDEPLPGLAHLRTTLQALPDSSIRGVLLAQVDAANGDVQKLRDNLAGWFDEAMDRVSGVFKRRMKWLSLFVAAALSIGLNANSAVLAQTLWQDAALRNLTVQAIPAVLAQQVNATDKAATPSMPLDQIEQHLSMFPLGWNSPAVKTTSLLMHLLGLLLTTLAVSLGAPFWFDLLQQIMNLRGGGTPPARSGAAGS